jgi:hypothetical protein
MYWLLAMSSAIVFVAWQGATEAYKVATLDGFNTFEQSLNILSTIPKGNSTGQSEPLCEQFPEVITRCVVICHEGLAAICA